MTIKVGLIGYGLAGRLLHAPLIRASGMEIVGVVTRRAAEVAADMPAARVFATAEALCAADIDLAVVVSPDHLHVAHAETALAAGKHVVIDKPVAPTSAEALRLTAEGTNRGLLLTVFHNRRWDSDFLTVQKLIGEEALGEITYYAVRWDRYRPSRSGGWRDTHMRGELYGLGSHLMDQALVLFGAPDWLWADVYKQRPGPGQSDGFDILMGKGRLRIMLSVNLLAADELRACRVLGTKAAFVKTGLDTQEAQLRARADPAAPSFGVEKPEAWGKLISGGSPDAAAPVKSERGDWCAFYRGVREAIKNKSAPPVPPQDAARVIAMLEAAMESSRSGNRIEIPAWLAAHRCA